MAELSNPFDREERPFHDLIQDSEKTTLHARRSFCKITVNQLNIALRRGEIVYNQHNRFVDKTRTFEGFDIDLLDPIILAEKEGLYYILDGQHRIEYLRTFPHGEAQILLDIRTYISDEEFIRQLKIVNSRQIMEVVVDSDPVRRKYAEFQDLFLRNIYFRVEFKKNRPYVNSNTLMNTILGTNLFQSPRTTPQDILDKIILINRFISSLDSSEWSVEGGIDELYIQKARRETNYYLAFDKDYHSIRELIDVDPSTFEIKWTTFLTKRRKRSAAAAAAALRR